MLNRVEGGIIVAVLDGVEGRTTVIVLDGVEGMTTYGRFDTKNCGTDESITLNRSTMHHKNGSIQSKSTIYELNLRHLRLDQLTFTLHTHLPHPWF
jgi:hypothetical protein